MGRRKEMVIAKSIVSFNFFLFILLSISGRNWAEAADCTVAVKGGGCPDKDQCLETCRPCYRGVGEVTAWCRPAGGDIPFDECMCTMRKGAPCDPPAPPQCPKLPPGSVVVNLTYH